MASLSRMRGIYNPSMYVDNFTVPRMTARQIKYYVARIQRNILNTVLNKLQQIFKSSKGCDKWMAAFIAVIGLGMAHEDQQKTLHVVMETKHTTEGINRLDAQARANHACREIDSRMDFICQIFRWKYNRKWNPLRDSDHDWRGELGFGDKDSVEFIKAVSQLVKENSMSCPFTCPHYRIHVDICQLISCKHAWVLVSRMTTRRNIRHGWWANSCCPSGSRHKAHISNLFVMNPSLRLLPEWKGRPRTTRSLCFHALLAFSALLIYSLSAPERYTFLHISYLMDVAYTMESVRYMYFKRRNFEGLTAIG